ncbi:hypothetical protein M9H77_09548 [Catharanthus roseus]|uniref:Uncharacterized protein n=1 Tax=Catharanthus roseus TaxID=4058 RepID=A0ACC0C1G5_CATRO|nr:hypothetical protein M9H77_09548 [Catharanthus roseus]
MSISHLVANDPEIPVSNFIEEVQVLFQIGCTYKRAWNRSKAGSGSSSIYKIHRICLCHIRANSNKTFNSTELKSLMWQAGIESKLLQRKWYESRYLCTRYIFVRNVQKNIQSEFSSGLE